MAKEKKSSSQANSKVDEGEVLLKVGPLKYSMPGKRQRVVLGSIVLGLNVILALLVIAYFYSPTLQEFIYNVGRN